MVIKEVGVLLRRSDYRAMQWKNGRGTTEEIAIDPPGAVFSDQTPFLWRLSTAQVNEGGAFSLFPGYRRMLTLVEGSELKLYFGPEKRNFVLRQGEVCEFSGDETVFTDSGVSGMKDLNFIWRVNQVKVCLEVISFKVKPRSFHLSGHTSFVFAMKGGCYATVYPGELKFQIQEGETLHLNLFNQEKKGEMLLFLESEVLHGSVVLIELK